PWCAGSPRCRNGAVLLASAGAVAGRGASVGVPLTGKGELAAAAGARAPGTQHAAAALVARAARFHTPTDRIAAEADPTGAALLVLRAAVGAQVGGAAQVDAGGAVSQGLGRAVRVAAAFVAGRPRSRGLEAGQGRRAVADLGP